MIAHLGCFFLGLGYASFVAFRQFLLSTIFGVALFWWLPERFDEPSHFDLLWGELGDEEPGETASLVQFSLAPDGPDRTLVAVVESGFTHLDTAARRAAMEDNVTGWTLVLDAFVRHAETVA